MDDWFNQSVEFPPSLPPSNFIINLVLLDYQLCALPFTYPLRQTIFELKIFSCMYEWAYGIFFSVVWISRLFFFSNWKVV